ncbi:hypothetical protein ABZ192_30740 [Streptomyces sp. NPDC006235]|uniref:hypothetical protein n=1 Tax=Streptomyces sp. NPDC006235 TaxID=3156736 RepID=UPI0033BC9EDD
MLLYIAVMTYLLLFLAFGWVLLPLKAIAMNMLSLTATFGVLVWIFQNGHLHHLLGFDPTGYDRFGIKETDMPADDTADKRVPVAAG